MSRVAERVLRERGIKVCLGSSVAQATADGVHLSDGRFLPSRTLVSCVGVRPDPLVEATGLPTTRPDPVRPPPMTAQHAVRQGRPYRAARPGFRRGPGWVAGHRKPAARTPVRAASTRRSPRRPRLATRLALMPDDQRRVDHSNGDSQHSSRRDPRSCAWTSQRAVAGTCTAGSRG
ncbi:FAD-dependent oxidoreductase [Micromonospora lupini]|nr:FAD-dependent oxidoreductase [Micromonospora lupini]